MFQLCSSPMEVPLLRQDGQLCSFSHLKLCNSKLLKNIMHLAVILGTSGISALCQRCTFTRTHTETARERKCSYHYHGNINSCQHNRAYSFISNVQQLLKIQTAFCTVTTIYVA